MMNQSFKTVPSSDEFYKLREYYENYRDLTQKEHVLYLKALGRCFEETGDPVIYKMLILVLNELKDSIFENNKIVYKQNIAKNWWKYHLGYMTRSVFRSIERHYDKLIKKDKQTIY